MTFPDLLAPFFLWRNQAAALGLMVAIQLVTSVGGWLLLLALGVELPLVVHVFVWALMNFFFLVPASVAGFGVREASFIILFGMFGVSRETSLAASFITLACALAAIAPGGGLWLARLTARRGAVTRRRGAGAEGGPLPRPAGAGDAAAAFFDLRRITREAGGLWVPLARSEQEVSYAAEDGEFCFRTEETSFWFEHRNRVIRSVLGKAWDCRRLFDIGGGNGFVAAWLQGLGYPVALVEPHEQSCRNALRREVSHVLCANLEEARSIIRVGEGDVVLLCDVLEHFTDDRGVVRTVAQMLSPGATLLLTVPTYRWLWSAVDVESGHHRRYTRAAVVRLLAEHGLEPLFSSYFFSFLVIPVLLMRSLRLGARSEAEEHARPTAGLAARVLRWLTAAELFLLDAGVRVPFGTSCVVLARKAGPAPSGGSGGPLRPV